MRDPLLNVVIILAAPCPAAPRRRPSTPQLPGRDLHEAVAIFNAGCTVASMQQRPVEVDDARALRDHHARRHGERCSGHAADHDVVPYQCPGSLAGDNDSACNPSSIGWRRETADKACSAASTSPGARSQAVVTAAAMFSIPQSVAALTGLQRSRGRSLRPAPKCRSAIRHRISNIMVAPTRAVLPV